MEAKKVIVMYGGAFNPPHSTHFSIAQQVLNQFNEVEKVVFVPVNKKYEKDELEDDMHRYNMLKCIGDKNEGFDVSNIDLDDKRSLYTIEIMEKMQKEHPNNEIWFLIGSDNLKDLKNWNKAEELITEFKALVMERSNDCVEDIINESEFLKKHESNILKMHEAVKSNCSSTYIRSLIRSNKSIRYLVPDEINEYIKNNNLYKSDNGDIN